MVQQTSSIAQFLEVKFHTVGTENLLLLQWMLSDVPPQKTAGLDQIMWQYFISHGWDCMIVSPCIQDCKSHVPYEKIHYKA